jgi:hypothetical protein
MSLDCYIKLKMTNPLAGQLLDGDPGQRLDSRKIEQPLHPLIKHRLDPQYVQYHEAHLQYTIPDDMLL